MHASARQRLERRLQAALDRVGEDVVLSPVDGDQVETRAVFSNNYEAAQLAGFSIESNSPFFLLESAIVDQLQLKGGDAIHVISSAVDYVVREVQPNGYGATRVRATEKT